MKLKTAKQKSKKFLIRQPSIHFFFSFTSIVGAMGLHQVRTTRGAKIHPTPRRRQACLRVPAFDIAFQFSAFHCGKVHSTEAKFLQNDENTGTATPDRGHRLSIGAGRPLDYSGFQTVGRSGPDNGRSRDLLGGDVDRVPIVPQNLNGEKSRLKNFAAGATNAS
jgi:hypothetical protein